MAGQWIGLHVFTAVGPGSIPGWEAKIPEGACCVVKGTRKERNKRHCHHPGRSKGLRSPVSGTGVKDQTVEQKILPVLLSPGKLQGF